MFKVGEKYKIYKNITAELKEKKWVKAVVRSMNGSSDSGCIS